MSNDQDELCKIISDMSLLTKKVCEKFMQRSMRQIDRSTFICEPPNCPIGLKEASFKGYHCRMCAAKELLIDLRDSQILLQD